MVQISTSLVIEKKIFMEIPLERIKSICEEKCSENNMEMEFFQSNHEGELLEKFIQFKMVLKALLLILLLTPTLL